MGENSPDDTLLTAESTGSNASNVPHTAQSEWTDADVGLGRRKSLRSNSWYVAQSEWTDADIGLGRRKSGGGGSATAEVKEKIQLLKNMNVAYDEREDNNVLDCMFDTSEMDFAPTSRALYAGSVKDGELVFVICSSMI